MTQYFAPHVDYYKVEVVVSFLWLPSTIIGGFILLKVYNFVARLRKYPPMRREFLVCWVSINVFIFLPRIARMLIRPWECGHFDTFRNFWNTNTICAPSDNIFQTWVIVSAVGLIVFCVGMPLAYYFVLKRYKTTSRIDDKDVCQMLGFFFGGYEPHFYYFECIHIVRRVLFVTVVHIPGLGAENYTDTFRTRAVTLAIIAIFFYGLHQACAPYDNRGYFILDRIETASLQAITITVLLQVWVLNTDKAESILESGSAKSARDTCVAIIIALSHLRFLAFVLWGLCRSFCLHWTEKLRKHRGFVAIRRDGFEFEHLSFEEQRLFGIFIAELTSICQHISKKFVLGEVLASLQRISLECQKECALTETDRKGRIHQAVFYLREAVSQVMGRESKAAQVTRNWSRKFIELTGLSSNEDQAKEALFKDRAEAQRLSEFTAENFARIVGNKYSVEELYCAFSRLGLQACRYTRPLSISDKLIRKCQDARKKSVNQHEDGFVPDFDEVLYVGHLDSEMLLRTEIRTSQLELKKVRAEVKRLQSMLDEATDAPDTWDGWTSAQALSPKTPESTVAKVSEFVDVDEEVESEADIDESSQVAPDIDSGLFELQADSIKELQDLIKGVEDDIARSTQESEALKLETDELKLQVSTLKESSTLVTNPVDT